MKLDELFEGPYRLGGTKPPSITRNVFMSDAALKRGYDFLGDLTQAYGDTVFSFWLIHSKSRAIITIRAKDDIGEDRNLIVSELTFSNREQLPVANQLQVDEVETLKDFRDRGLALGLYVLLCRYGFTIVSDYSQYEDGEQLWKKIAREAKFRKYTVRVYDLQSADWLRDETGTEIKYDTKNIDDAKIWHDMNTHPGQTTLLVLTGT